MRIAVLVALLMLAACVNRPSEPTPYVACQVDSRPFIESWPCVRQRVGSTSDNSDIRATYIATGDYVADEIRAGRMTEAQGKLTMARAGQAAVDAAKAREAGDRDPVAEYLVLRRFLPR